MNETMMYLIGHVGTDIDHRRVSNGSDVAKFRLAATPRYFDKRLGIFVDDNTNWITVQCWRSLAVHVSESIRRGDPVIVVGKLRTEEWVKDGQRNSRFILEASAVGHDLTRGVSSFTKASHSEPARDEATEAIRDLERAFSSGATAEGTPPQQRLADAS